MKFAFLVVRLMWKHRGAMVRGALFGAVMAVVVAEWSPAVPQFTPTKEGQS